jgi:hypothetical protein
LCLVSKGKNTRIGFSVLENWSYRLESPLGLKKTAAASIDCQTAAKGKET